MKIPVSIVTDLDNRPEANGNFLPFDKLEGKAKTKYDNLIKDKEDYKSTNIKLELAEEWTLEWCLYCSTNLSELFKKSLKMFPQLYLKALLTIYSYVKKESSSKLDKVKIATDFAKKLKKMKD